jgi:hypothetical protein
MWQNVAKDKNVEKMWQGGQKCGKCHIYVAKSPPWQREIFNFII